MSMKKRLSLDLAPGIRFPQPSHELTSMALLALSRRFPWRLHEFEKPYSVSMSWNSRLAHWAATDAVEDQPGLRARLAAG